jgi:hypothetical protein
MCVQPDTAAIREALDVIVAAPEYAVPGNRENLDTYVTPLSVEASIRSEPVQVPVTCMFTVVMLLSGNTANDALVGLPVIND